MQSCKKNKKKITVRNVQKRRSETKNWDFENKPSDERPSPDLVLHLKIFSEDGQTFRVILSADHSDFLEWTRKVNFNQKFQKVRPSLEKRLVIHRLIR